MKLFVPTAPYDPHTWHCTTGEFNDALESSPGVKWWTYEEPRPGMFVLNIELKWWAKPLWLLAKLRIGRWVNERRPAGIWADVRIR